MEPLREEVESIIAEEGWSKASIGKMRKLDSFLKESQRLNGVGCGESRDPLLSSDRVSTVARC